MSLIRKHVAVLQAWACLDLVIIIIIIIRVYIHVKSFVHCNSEKSQQ